MDWLRMVCVVVGRCSQLKLMGGRELLDWAGDVSYTIPLFSTTF